MESVQEQRSHYEFYHAVSCYTLLQRHSKVHHQREEKETKRQNRDISEF
jgi:hypothetical protein